MKKKNPLYHVDAQNVVKEANGYLDLLLKKFNLDEIFKMISLYFQQVIELVNSYAVLDAIKKWVDEMVLKFQSLIATGIAL